MGAEDFVRVTKQDLFAAINHLATQPAPDGIDDTDLLGLAVDRLWAFLKERDA